MNTRSSDASDWLSPIIVKELRQGMRGRVFLGSFLLLQLAMMVCASGGLVAASLISVDQFRFFSILFWIIIGVPLLLVIPSLGNIALRGELQANSLELVYLTRLTPWRIVAGKWAALFAQGLLFVFAVLPYLVLRYFLGGIDLVNELIVLLTLLLLCALLTAAAVGFSAHSTWLVRVAQGLFFFIILTTGVNLLFVPAGSFFFSSTGGGIEQNPFVLAAVFTPLTLLLMFEIGTGKIAPAADSRSFHLRVLGLLFLSSAAVLELAGTGSGMAASLAVPALLLIALLSVCESPRWIRSIYLPYTRRGWAAWMVGRFLLYPGWPSAVLYVTIVTAIASPLLLGNSATLQEDLLPLLLIYAGIIFPVAVTRFIRPATPHGFAWFLSIHLGMLLLALLIYIFHEAGISGAAGVVSFLPTTLALLLGWDVLSMDNSNLFMTVISGTIVLSLAVLFIRALPLLPLIRKMEQPAPPQADSAEA